MHCVSAAAVLEDFFSAPFLSEGSTRVGKGADYELIHLFFLDASHRRTFYRTRQGHYSF